MEKKIIRAIERKHLIKFNYGRFLSIAEPHVIGIKDGKKQVLVYQVGGKSSSGGLPNWRRPSVHDMSNLQILSETFNGPRPFPSGRHSSWDTRIAVVK